MQKYYLKVSSTNEKSLKTFLSFLLKHFKTEFNITQTQAPTQIKRKRVTLLKSPHVNKTAQEHFEVATFTKRMVLETKYSIKSLMFLKKTLNSLFQDISIQLELVSSKNLSKKTRFLPFNPNNFKLFKKVLGKNGKKHLKLMKKAKNRNIQVKSLAGFAQFLNKISIFGETILLTKKF